MTRDAGTLRSRLRGLSSFPGLLPQFDIADVGDDPVSLFAAWLGDAITSGHPAPHAAVLATSRRDAPSARVLILKDVDPRGWHIATHASSPTGRDLTDNPVAALTFFWPLQGRQVRVSGPVTAASAAESAADFSARPLASRVATLVGHQSDVLHDPADYAAGEEAARRTLHEHPDAVDSDWTVFVIAPNRVEFWQASTDRRHKRLVYTRHEQGWNRTTLRP